MTTLLNRMEQGYYTISRTGDNKPVSQMGDKKEVNFNLIKYKSKHHPRFYPVEARDLNLNIKGKELCIF